MMPKFIGNDSLIARINEVEGCMYRQSNELGRLNKAVRMYKAENAKLRELVRDAWGNGHPDKSCGDCEIMDECHEHMKNSHPFERCLFEIRIEERMRELGIEVKS